MMRGRLLQIITPQQGKEDPITLAHPEGPYMQIHRELEQEELNPSGESGERTEDATLYSPLPPHL